MFNVKVISFFSFNKFIKYILICKLIYILGIRNGKCVISRQKVMKRLQNLKVVTSQIYENQ